MIMPVTPNQVFLYSGATLEGTFTTIQAAINAASPFDTIQIGAGTYDENVNVTVNGLTIENVAGAQVTIVGQGGYAGALNVAQGVYGVTIQSSDGVDGNFVVEGSPTSAQLAALYIVGNNDDITINGITTIAPVTGDGGLNSVLTGGNLNNVLFENNVFTGSAGQLVYVNGAEDIGPQAQDGLVSFVGNTFSGSATGPLLGMNAPGEIINNTFTGTGAVDVGLGEAGVTVTGNIFDNSPTYGYFLGNGAYDPLAIELNNVFSQGTIFVVHNGVPQDGVYTSIQAAIDAAHAGDTVFIGDGTYDQNVALADGVNLVGQSEGGVVINGVMSTPADFDNTTVSNLTVNDSSSSAMLLDMTATQEVTSSAFNDVTFNLDSLTSSAAQLIGNGQVAHDMALNGTGLAFAGVTVNSNDSDLTNPNSPGFAYFLFHTTGNAQMLLDGVSLNGDASGPVSGSNNLVAQWNMSPGTPGENAAATIENSSTSDGGNFYLSGLNSVTITGSTFTGQGVVLNGDTNASVTGNTFQNIDTTYSPGNIGTNSKPDYEHPGLAIENAFGTTGDSNISITGNTFQNISAANGAIAFENFTDAGGDEIPATIGTLNTVTIESNTFTNVATPVYVDTQAAGGLLPSTLGDQQVLIAPTGNATVTAPASGNTDILGGGSPNVDTVTDTGITATSFSVVNGQWTVNNGTTVDTLYNIDHVVDGSFLLVGDGGYATIQDAVNAASAGDTILVAPGTYNEQVTISGNGLTGLTIEGVGSGVNVDAPTATGSLLKTALSNSGNAIDGIFTVSNANDVTISGLTVNGLEEGDDTYFAPGQPGEASLVGIAYINTSGGSINGVTVEGTRETDAGVGDQRNLGIVVENTDPLTGDVPTQSQAAALNTIAITNSTVENFQKNGITVEYANATISGNTIIGIPDINNAQNAIEVEGSTGTVSDNTITNIGYSGTTAAATGVLAFDDYGIDITGNSFTGALGPGNTLLVSPVGYYVLDSNNGQITDNTSTNVDDGIVGQSEGFGAGDTDELTGTWTVSGNTATNVVSLANGGSGIYFNANPTTSTSSFTINDSTSGASDELFLTPGTDTLTGGTAGNNIFVVLNGPDLGAGDTVNGGGGTGNTIDFAPSTANETLTIGSNVTNIQDVNVVDQTALLTTGSLVFTDTTSETINATNASNGLTITANDGGDTITGTATFNDTLIGGTGNDTFVLGTGSDSVTGGGGIDTVKVGTGYHIAIQNGQWVVTNSVATDTLSGIDKVVIGGKTYDLVDDFGAKGGFQSLQAAIDNASSGDTILVAPGTYTEQANYNATNNTDTGTSDPVGLLVNKSVTIEGVDGSGNAITSSSDTQATIISAVQSDWGTNFFVTAPNVTISGLTFQATDNQYVGPSPLQNEGIVNKAFEDIANNFTLENSLVNAASGVPLGSSVYIDDWAATSNPSFVSSITQYDVTGNTLDGDFVEASGVGFGHQAASLSLQFTNNEFSLNTGTTADTYAQQDGGYANESVILNGDLLPGVAWDLAPVAAPTLTGNTVDADYTESPTGGRFFAADDSAANLPSLSYIQNYVANNTLGTYAYVVTPGGKLETPLFNYGTQSSPSNSYTFQIYINAGDATAPATALGPDGANPGDTVIVQSGSNNSVQTIGTNNLTIKALSGSTALDLSLGSGVTTITLADYAVGQGANVTVTGNNSGDTITGNDGNDTLNGGTGNDTFNLGSGSNTVTGGGGLDTAHFSSTLTPADFSFSNSEWVVTNGGGTDDLSGVSVVTDGAGDTFLLVGGGSQYSSPNQAFTSPQHTSNSIDIIDTPSQDEVPVVTVNSGGQYVGAAGASSVAFSVSSLDDDESGTLTFSDGQGDKVTLQVVQGTSNRIQLNSNPVTTVNLSSLDDGTITTTLSVTDTAGNSDSVNGNQITLDQDVHEQASLALTVTDSDVGKSAASTVPFTLAGLDSEDAGTVTFTDSNNKTITVSVTGTQTSYTANLATLADGTITSSLQVNTDPAGNAFTPVSGTTFTLDQDVGESLSVSVDNGSSTPIGGPSSAGVESTAVSFAVSGLDTDDSGTLTFKDSSNHTVAVTISGGAVVAGTNNTTTTVDLSSLADGTITSSLSASDPAGNHFSTSGNIVTLDQDAGESPSVSVDNGSSTPIGGPSSSGVESTAVAFAVSGLDTDDSGTLTFKDSSNHTVAVTISGGAVVVGTNNTTTTVDLSSLADGTITSSLSASDPAGNHFSTSGNIVTLDQDVTESPSVSVDNGSSTPIGGPSSSGVESTAVAFAVSGLDTDDSGTLTFKDSSNHTVAVTISGGAVVAGTNNTTTTVDLSSLADGTITSSLSASDPAGNHFSTSGNIVTLDQDVTESPSVSVDNGSSTPIGGPSSSGVESTAVAFAVSGLDTDDSGTLTFSDGTHQLSVAIAGGQVVAGANNTTTTVNLSSLADGTITSSLTASDPAGNHFSTSGNIVTLDQDGTESPSVSVDNGSSTPIGGPLSTGVKSTAVSFTVSGLDTDDSGTLTFKDSSNHTVAVTISGGQVVAGANNTLTTVNLSSLADGTITSSLAASDPAGNHFSTTGNSVTLDQDVGESPSVSVDNGSSTSIGGPSSIGVRSTAVPFTVSGLDSDDSGTLTFSDGTHQLSVAIAGGQVVAGTNNTTTTVNLLSFFDGPVTSSLSVSDAAGNHFSANGNGVTLDQDIGEQAALVLNVTVGEIDVTAASAVPFTIAGLDSEDTGTVTFTDSANHTVSVNVAGTQNSYTANLSTLNTGTITSSLRVNTDPAGNTFTAIAGATIQLDPPPVANADSNLAVVGGSSVNGNVLNNDVAASALTVTGINDTSHGAGAIGSPLAGLFGTLSIASNGAYIYTANGSINAPTGSHPTDSFTYNEADAHGGTATSTLTVTLDRPPTSTAHDVFITEDASTGLAAADDSDPDGDGVTVTGVNGGSVGAPIAGTYGTLTINGNDTFTYAATNTNAIAAASSTPIDTFTYTASDGLGGTATETLNFAINRHPNESQAGGPLSSVFWRQSGGALADWEMSGATASSGTPTSQGKAVTPDSSWSVAGIADFDGNGSADMLWRQASTGSLAIWLMNGSTITSSAAPTFEGQAASPNSTWSIVGVADFNGNGDADILWRQSGTGALVEWGMNGTTIASNANVTYQGQAVAPNSTWSVAGVGDFNGDGDADLLWRQSTTGALQEWQMNGSTVESSTNLTYQGSVVAPNSSWSMVGVGDFNGDGKEDLLWRQGSTGTLAIWLMNGSTVESTASVTYQGSAVKPDSSWNVVDIGDFNGGSESDILWQQSTTGSLLEWQMNGSQIVSSQEVTSQGSPVTPPSSWQVQNKPTNFA